jgi:hypothetical protein
MTTMPPLRDRIAARKLEPNTPTEYTRGVNDGIDVAIEVLDAAATELGQQRSDQVTAAHVELRTAGKLEGGPPPYGYQLGDDGETLVVHAGEQAVIAAVRSMRFAERRSWREIAAALLAVNMRSRTGRRFVPAQLRRIVLTTRPMRLQGEPVPTSAPIPVSRPQPGMRASGERRATKRPAPRRKKRR